MLSIRHNWQEQRRDPHLGQKQHRCYSDPNTHGWLRVPSSEPKEEGFSYEVGEPLLSKWQSCHSQSCGYDHIDKRGEEVENWQDDHKLNLINKPEDQPTFYSRRWRTTSTPELAFCTDDLDSQISREVREQLSGSDHRLVLLTMNTYISCESTLPRCNYKKADWILYSLLTKSLKTWESRAET